MDGVAELFEKKEYYHAFQPICSLSGKGKMGYGALLRSASGINPPIGHAIAA